MFFKDKNAEELGSFAIEKAQVSLDDEDDLKEELTKLSSNLDELKFEISNSLGPREKAAIL